jgi:hypothetical protein
MKVITYLILGLLFPLISYSQENFWKVECETSEYYTDTLYNQLNLIYSNISDNTLIIWIDKSYIDTLPNTRKIKDHFFTKKGDWSLMQLIWDGNVESYVPGLFDSFIKVVRPKELFTVSILKIGKISSDMAKDYEKHVNIVLSQDIKGLNTDSSVDMFNYKSDNVVILAEWLE